MTAVLNVVCVCVCVSLCVDVLHCRTNMCGYICAVVNSHGSPAKASAKSTELYARKAGYLALYE